MSVHPLELATPDLSPLPDAPSGLAKGRATSWMAPVGDTLSADTPLPEAIRLMLASECDHLVVVDERGELIGLVGYRALIALVADGSYKGPDTVATLVSKQPPSVQATQSFAEALRKLNEPAVTCVVVLEGRRPVGLICERQAAHPTLELIASSL